MKAAIYPAPWTKKDLSSRAYELEEILDGSWREAASRYTAILNVRRNSNLKVPKGVQPFLNDVLDERFSEAGWDGKEGRFRKGNTWVRITFRHQMSLGSDFIDALRLSKQDGVRECILLACTSKFLEIVTPSDANSVISFEKMAREVQRLNGSLDINLFYGSLTASSKLPKDVHQVINGRLEQG
jgi:hypothetical protein